MGNNAGLYAACLTAALLLAGCNDAGVCRNCSGGGAEPCPSSPILAASAGNGEVTLTWEPAGSQGTAVKAWQYRQAVQGESWSGARNAGPAATAYVVSGLTNGLAYRFQVRPQFAAADFGCWSAAVSVVPRRMDDVMGRMEKHQEAIAKRMSEVVEGMAASQELQRTLGEREIATLGEVVDGLAEVAAQLGKVCDGCGVPPANCRSLGQVFFGHNSHHIRNENGNKETFNQIVSGLQVRKGGLFLTEGYASAVGYARHNLHLSDQRAACVSRCLHDRLAHPWLEDGKFQFREIARGEVFGVNDLAGANKQHRRVDVTFCPGYSNSSPNAEKRPPVWPTDCACPSDSQPI